MARELVTGFPVNEFTQSQKLFGSLYFVNCKGGLEKWKHFIKGGFLEQHFQQFSEVKSVSIHDFVAQINEYRKQDLDVTMHCPFLRSHPPKGFLDFDFEWLVVPEIYMNTPIKEFEIEDNGAMKRIQMKSLEAKLEDLKQTLDLASAADIKTLTVHVTTPGIFLSPAEWKRYTNRVCELGAYIRDNRKDVAIAIETGGVAPHQLEKLCNDVKSQTGYDVAFNLDTAHLLLDFMEILKKHYMGKGMDEEQAKKKTEEGISRLNKAVVDFYNKNHDKIRIVHLSQTGLWADLHLGIEDSLGIISCNEELIRTANGEFEQSGVERYLMIESEPTKKGIWHFIKAKSGEITGEKKQGTNDSVMIFMGRPCNGKSQALELLQEADVVGEEANVVRTDALREKYKRDAYSLTKWVSRKNRQLVYDEGFRRAELAMRLRKGTVFDATFDQRKNREAIYNHAMSKGVRNFYVLDFYCEVDEAIGRIVRRDESLSQKERTGLKPGDSLCMRNPMRYTRFHKEFQDLDMRTEFNSTDDMRVHVIRVDTSKGANTIKLYNPDQKARAIAQVLKEEYKKKHPEADYTITVHENE